MTKSPKELGETEALAETRAPGEIPLSEIEAIINGKHTNPFAVLGVHQIGGGFMARCFIPGAEEAIQRFQGHAHTTAHQGVHQ